MTHSIGRDVNLEEIYTQEDYDYEQQLRDRDIVHYRTKTINSGGIIEIEIYPVWKTATNSSRARRQLESRECQKKLNKINRENHVVRLINSNFTDDDIWGTFTYEVSKRPTNIEDAQREMSKFVRRLKYYAKKLGYEPLKYLYVTEVVDDPAKNKFHIHHHIVMNFPDRDLAESLWKNGARTQTKRLQADESGYEGLARYIMKDPRGTKRYVASHNLVQPQITISDYKFSRRKVAQMVTGELSPYQVFEDMHQGYQVVDTYYRTSEYVSGAYIYAKLTPKKYRRIYPNGIPRNTTLLASST